MFKPEDFRCGCEYEGCEHRASDWIADRANDIHEERCPAIKEWLAQRTELVAEVKRLRGCLQTCHDDNMEIHRNAGALIAERDQLRARVAELEANVPETPDTSKARLADLTDEYTLLEAEFEQVEADNTRLREALQQVTAHAGHPDAAEGCRIIISVTRAALEGKP